MNHGFNELQFLNLVLVDRQDYFKKYQVDRRYFFMYPEIYDFIVEHKRTFNEYPSLERVVNTYEMFEAVELDNPDFAAATLKQSSVASRLYSTLTKAGEAYDSDDVRCDHSALLDSLIAEATEIKRDSLPASPVYDWAAEAKDRFEHFMKTARKEDGTIRVPTGFKRMDKAFGGGMAGGDVVVIFARMKNFKSWVGERISVMAFAAGFTGLIVSLEMTTMATSFRADTLYRNFSNKGLNEGDLEKVDAGIYEEYVTDLAGRTNHLYIATNDRKDGRRWSLNMVWETAERLGVDFILIDQLSLLAWDKKYPSKTVAYDDMSGTIKNMATGLNVPVVLLAQAGRGVMNKFKEDKDAMPENEDIQWSDSVMQYADKGVSIRKTEGGVVKTRITANRGGEEGQEFTYKWEADRGIVEDYDAAATKF